MSFCIWGDIWNSPPVIRSAASWIGYSLWSRHRQNECVRSLDQMWCVFLDRNALIEVLKFVAQLQRLPPTLWIRNSKRREFRDIRTVYGVYVHNDEVWVRPSRDNHVDRVSLIDRLISKALLNWERGAPFESNFINPQAEWSGAISRACLSVVREFETVPDDRKRALRFLSCCGPIVGCPYLPRSCRRRVMAAQSEPKMRTETLLRKLHLQASSPKMSSTRISRK